MKDTAQKAARWVGRTMAAAAIFMGLQACGLGSTDVDTPPETARIVVEGTAPSTLRLVYSTDFIETYDQVEDIYGQSLADSDTLAIDLPFETTVALLEGNGDGSIFVELTNLELATASVTMKVYVDGKIEYNQAATMSDGASLRFVFTYYSPIL